MTARDQWLEWRRQGIGASDVAGILGISPWSSPWSVWADKMGLLPPEPETEAMSAGRWLEAAIGPWFQHETGLYVAGEQTQCTHSKWPWVRCTVDGFVTESGQSWIQESLGLIEIKVVGPGKRWDVIPPHYQAQGQWQMLTTTLERVWFAVLMGRRLDIHVLERDEADIDYMIERADLFWSDHVQTGTPPPTDGSDATLRALGAVYPEQDDAQAVEVDPELIELWGEAKADEREAEKRRKTWAAAIEAQLGDAAIGEVDGRKVVSWRSQTRTTVCPACHHKTVSDPYRVLRSHVSKEKT